MDTTPAQQATIDTCNELIERLAGLRSLAAAGDWNALLALSGEIDKITPHLTEYGATMAREAGASWAAIGSELGMSRQGAEQRFGDFARGFLYA